LIEPLDRATGCPGSAIWRNAPRRGANRPPASRPHIVREPRRETTSGVEIVAIDHCEGDNDRQHTESENIANVVTRHTLTSLCGRLHRSARGRICPTIQFTLLASRFIGVHRRSPERRVWHITRTGETLFRSQTYLSTNPPPRRSVSCRTQSALTIQFCAGGAASFADIDGFDIPAREAADNSQPPAARPYPPRK
jgi:hypothetical protein